MVQGQQSRVGRRLSAIFAADVAGYSRLMGIDEVGTARTLREHRAVTDAVVEKHGGRIVKTTGDGVLVEFLSVVDAVECAVAMQAAMAERNDDVPEDRRMRFRIGINLGDILIEGDDILGDGVNVAARLEGVAEPGGICISSSAYEQVRDKVAVEFVDLGEQSLKNIARPVRAYAVARSFVDRPRHGATSPSPPSAPRLSIVVLPFVNIGGDPEQDYFVDGVTDSLTTDLSRINGSFVIARNTAFTFKGKAVDVKRLGQELNIRYVLEGSLQRGGTRLRVNVQLIDAQTGNHLWAERFDKPLADLFGMQDEIVSRLANTLNAELVVAEARRAEHGLNPDTVDLYFRGIAAVYKGPVLANMTEARAFFERALALDPQNVEATVGTAIVDFNKIANFFDDDREVYLASAETALIKALSLAPRHPLAHMYLGVILIFTNRVAEGIAECEQALSLDANMADAYGWIGLAKYFIGRAAETEGHILDAMRLSPRDTYVSRWMLFVGYAKVQMGAYEEAVVWMRRAIEANRNFPLAHFYLSACLSLLGLLDEAQAVARAGLRLEPSFSIRRFRVNAPSNDPVYLAKREPIYEGMRMAGIPEC